MKRVIILSATDYWEAIYVDGKCLTQQHQIDRMYLLKLASEHMFTHDDVACIDAGEEDDEKAMQWGQFPDTLDELKDTDLEGRDE